MGNIAKFLSLCNSGPVLLCAAVLEQREDAGSENGGSSRTHTASGLADTNYRSNTIHTTPHQGLGTDLKATDYVLVEPEERQMSGRYFYGFQLLKQRKPTANR